MMVSPIGRPSCDRSLKKQMLDERRYQQHLTYLDVVALVVITAFSKKPMCYYMVDIQLIEDRVGILQQRRVTT